MNINYVPFLAPERRNQRTRPFGWPPTGASIAKRSDYITLENCNEVVYHRSLSVDAVRHSSLCPANGRGRALSLSLCLPNQIACDEAFSIQLLISRCPLRP